MIRFGGRSVTGFGIGLTPDEALRELEKFDPCRACHGDTFVKLKVFGAAIAASAVTVGVLALVWRK
jgi:hypothetical protein